MIGAGSQEASSAALVTVMRSLKRLSGTHASVIIASRSGYLGGKIERQEKTEQDSDEPMQYSDKPSRGR